MDSFFSRYLHPIFSLYEESEIKPITTSIKVGFVEGFVNGAAIVGVLLTAASVVSVVKGFIY